MPRQYPVRVVVGAGVRMLGPALALSLLLPDRVVCEPLPTIEDIALVARVMGFEQPPVAGALRLGVAFDPRNARSARSAETVVALLHGGSSLAGRDVSGVAIPQAALSGTTGIDAIFCAPGVDAAILRAALLRLHVPCLTLDTNQLGQGGCMIAVQSAPSVGIVLDPRNATAAGVGFATAFRMMVEER